MPNNYFRFKQFTVFQDYCAMKVGTDGTLLGAWADVPKDTPKPRILDAGTGTGLIALMMAQRFPYADVTGIDIEAGATKQARINAQASPFHDRIRIEETAIQDMKDVCFDAIVCNPPYFIGSLECPDKQRSIARHTSTLTYDNLMTAAYRLLDNHGELSVIVPSDCRDRMDAAAAISGFFPKRICQVKTKEGKPPKRFLLSYTKRQTTIRNEYIIIGDEEYNRMLSGFYLKL